MNTPHRPHHSLEHHLADRLADRAGHVELGTPMLDVVVGRGRQRQRRRRAAVGIAAVVGIAGGSVAAVAVLSRPADPDRITAAPTDETTPGTAGASTVPGPTTPTATESVPTEFAPSPFTWNRVDPDSTEAVSFYNGAPDDMVAGSGPFVVWSTAPAVSDDYSGVLWRSDDGLTWEQVAAPPALVGRTVAQYNGRFLTYGTAPATAAGRRSDLAIGTSDDAGRTWATTVLPLDTSELLAEQGVTSVGVNATSIAATTTGVLVTAQVNANVDLTSKLPAEVRDLGWDLTESGVRVPTGEGCDSVTPTTISFGGPTTTVAVAPDLLTCASRIYTWAELGISEAAAASMMHPEARMLFSTDGVTFTEIEPIGIDAGVTDVRLTLLGDAFVASANRLSADGSNTTNLYSSTDGRQWTSLGSPPVTWVEGFGSSGDRLVVTGYDIEADTQVIAVRDPSGTWTTTSINSFVLPTDGVQASMGGGSFAVGPNGISMVGALFVDPVAEVGGVMLSIDGLTIEIDDTSYTHRVIDDATGEVLATVTWETSSNPELVTVSYTDMGPRMEVRREPGGDVVADYTYEDLSNAVADATVNVVPTGPELFLLHSADGITWSRESLDEIAGATVTGTGGIRITDTQVIVAALLAGERNPNGTPKQTLLIATPTA
ncbi:MAG: hypothetical protein F2534_04295 [Actinobacteria bacterium]|uniref:Unannotated protein n=1 Tax=freshwater metagenome TaxID=449393 RepID=A0A6J6C8X8_9ZZZZ|nr:hypothetical protein [Actinomycetota bacterium]